MSYGSLTAEEHDALQPFLDASGPKENGEWDIHCPLHDDQTASASVNVDTGDFYCNACAKGGPLGWLLAQRALWVHPSGAGATPSRNGARSTERLSRNRVDGWHDNLIRCEPDLLQTFIDRRGINKRALRKHKIGYDGGRSAYTIPIFDRLGKLVNVRRYVLDGDPTRRKIWSVQGHGKPTLFPITQLRYKQIIICEGEWDAIATIMHGFHAITRTGAADVWRSEWTRLFKGKDVFLCHDADDAGQAANMKIAKALRKVARSVRIVKLPYAITEKHGKDLSDFWADHTAEEFQALLDGAFAADDERADPLVIAPSEATVMDASNPEHVAVPLRITVTLRSRSKDEFSVVKEYSFTCPEDHELRCEHCPLRESGENQIIGEIESNERMLLQLRNSSDDQVEKILKRASGIPHKCFPPFERLAYHSITGYEGVPSIDHVGEQVSGGEFKQLGILSSAAHDILAGQTVQVTGCPYPDPRTQGSRFLAWDMAPMETSLDRWELNDERIEQLQRFQVGKYAPLEKLRRIAHQMAMHVTKIYGRDEMHMAMDLVFHSALKFKFDGQSETRGWLELLVVGDTRTGKSEAAQRMIKHYGGGHLVSCETSTRAGIMAGTEKISDGSWGVSLGAMPMNDRRLVVLDEVSGLSPADISSMSSMRSEGIVQIQMIKSEKAYARTRAIWMSNPRDGGAMSKYKNGVDALRPVIGNDEDIARFDMAMTLSRGEVPSELINKSHVLKNELRYTAEACEIRRQWAWSRKEDDVVWEEASTAACYQEAEAMGKKYAPDPPLVQIENIRIKLSRIATAMAMCLVSTDDTFMKCIVREEHVRAAAEFLDMLYNMKGFGYGKQSSGVLRDREFARDSIPKVVDMLLNKDPIVTFLNGCGGHFKMFDIIDPARGTRDDGIELCNRLSDYKMITFRDGLQWIQPELYEVLRRLGK